MNTIELPTSFSEALRYENYDLTPDSLVIDCGFYKGEFALEMARRYNCWIESYEPVKEFYEAGREIVRSYKIKLFNYAVTASPVALTVGKHGAMSGRFATGDPQEVAIPKPLIDVIPVTGCDLLKLNVEGMEFEILECLIESRRMYDHSLAWHCKNIQVQFHPIVPDFQTRYESIRAKLLETHHLTYDFPWCWQNFRRNK